MCVFLTEKMLCPVIFGFPFDFVCMPWYDQQNQTKTFLFRIFLNFLINKLFMQSMMLL